LKVVVAISKLLNARWHIDDDCKMEN
jgi:hypothetical protein